ncbi:hypothetical protein BDA96_01G399800 [Sorghum bicolor]|uniref:Uncharacterized protein n=2 Tax=Sorghum bicolor TaxID=4558 RepID=A0A921S327_SORBI|nr:hypothetical protein BDA96_01G399800 [Sorghum bicolor]OQU92612.1 hypothetical protein SORBI_3001G375900 [Sorghum bicolor]
MRLVKVEAGLCSGDVLYPWPAEKEVVGKNGTETGEEVGQEDEDNAEATDESEDEMEV